MEAIQYVDGEWLPGEAEEMESVDPATGEAIDSFHGATEEQTERAIAAAAEASESWGRTTPGERDALLYDAADRVEAATDELAELLTREEGKPISNSRGEVVRTAKMFRYFAGDARRATGDTVPSNDPATFTYTIREPLGVVALITPWNFPVATPAWKLAPALAAGNAVVLKPSSVTPLVGRRLVELLADAGFPDGVLNYVVGAGSTVGAALTENESVDGLSFTGSTSVGRRIGETAGRRGIPHQTEMGGKNPLVVLPDADVEVAAEATVTGAFGGTGQSCTATSRVIVHEAVHESFTEALVEHTEALEVGPGTDDPDVGPAAHESQFETNLEYVEIAQDEGATLLTGGDVLDREGFFVRPAVFDDVGPETRLAQEEVFGPVLSVIPVADFAEAIEVANGVDYGLSASVFTGDVTRARQFVQEIEAGVVKINGTTTGSDLQMPFGGMKDSSSESHKELGQREYEFYTHEKAVYQTDPQWGPTSDA